MVSRITKKEININFCYIVLRYLIILSSAIGNFFIFYFIFTKPTIYLSYILLKIFYNVTINAETLIINGINISVIPACVAGAAYFLVFALNLSIKMRFITRIYFTIFSFLMLLVLNVLRIVVFSILLVNGSPFFDIAHMFTWYVLSVVFVVLIWFLSIKIFRTTEIPAYSDLKYIYRFCRKK
jgi:exosortase/archaeosortase family protein